MGDFITWFLRIGENFEGLIDPVLGFLTVKGAAPGLAVLIWVIGAVIFIIILVYWFLVEGRSIAKANRAAAQFILGRSQDPWWKREWIAWKSRGDQNDNARMIANDPEWIAWKSRGDQNNTENIVRNKKSWWKRMWMAWEYQREQKHTGNIENKYESNFRDNYNKLGRSLERNKKFSNSWHEFAETLINQSKNRNYYSNTIRPGEYFNSTELHMNMPILRTMPNIFVGVGLLLTFAGLISALSASVGGITSSDSSASSTEAMQHALSGLLNAASAKFYASLSALSVSILLSLLIRVKTKYIEKSIFTFCQRIELGVRFVSAESLVLDQLAELKQQTVLLTDFQNNIATKIGDQFEERVGNIFRGETQETIKIAAGESLKAISGEIKKLIKDFEVMSENLSDTSKSMSKASGELVANIAKAGTKIKDSTTGFENMLSGCRDILTKLQDELRRTQNVARINNESIKVIKDTVEELKTRIAETDKIWKENGERLEAADENLGKYFNELNKAATKSIEKIAEFAKKLDDRYKDSLASLGGAIDDLTDTLKTMQETLKEMQKLTKSDQVSE